MLDVSKQMKYICFSGSPFQYSVGQLSSGGYHKVQVGGPGVEKGEVGKESKYCQTSLSQSRFIAITYIS